MRDRFLAAWRTAAQALFALLVAWAANRGLHVDRQWTAPLELAAIGAGAGVWAYGTHWLQSRTGKAWWARAARGLGRVLVLGAGSVPVYPPAGSPAAPPASSPAVPPAAPVPPAGK